VDKFSKFKNFDTNFSKKRVSDETGVVVLLTESESRRAFRFESTSLTFTEHWVSKRRAEPVISVRLEYFYYKIKSLFG
jgi:hypothetical protein